MSVCRPAAPKSGQSKAAAQLATCPLASPCIACTQPRKLMSSYIAKKEWGEPGESMYVKKAGSGSAGCKIGGAQERRPNSALTRRAYETAGQWVATQH